MADREITIAEAKEIRDIYRPMPHKFINDALGSPTWFMQDQIAISVFQNKITAVKTCNAVGKSYIAARIAAAFLFLNEGSIVVTTAPTWRQVKDVLWREFAIAIKKAPYKLTRKEVRQTGLDLSEDWFAVGLSTNYPENFFGYHADYILVIVDEAGGVPEPIFKGVKAITPNINARILYIGNPTNPSGTFYDAFDTQKNLPVKRFTVSAFQTPNFTANNIHTVNDLIELFTPPEGIEVADWMNDVEQRLNMPIPELIAPSTVYLRYLEWGVDSPAWQSLVMGEFPSQSEQALFPTDLVRMAMNMGGIDTDTGKTYAELSGWKIPEGMPTVGQDMARYGDDRCVATPRRGGWVARQIKWGKTSLMDSADRILNIIDPLDPSTTVNIDDSGNGGGTTDRLRQIDDAQKPTGKPNHQYRLNAYVFGSKEMMSDDDREKFHDITSKIYWDLRTELLNKRIAFEAYDQDLFDQMVGRRWGMTPQGRIKVESKDEYKKRTGGKSPDECDSLALAFAKSPYGSFMERTPPPPPARYAHGSREPELTTSSITAGLMDKTF